MPTTLPPKPSPASQQAVAKAVAALMKLTNQESRQDAWLTDIFRPILAIHQEIVTASPEVAEKHAEWMKVMTTSVVSEGVASTKLPEKSTLLNSMRVTQKVITNLLAHIDDIYRANRLLINNGESLQDDLTQYAFWTSLRQTLEAHYFPAHTQAFLRHLLGPTQFESTFSIASTFAPIFNLYATGISGYMNDLFMKCFESIDDIGADLTTAHRLVNTLGAYARFDADLQRSFAEVFGAFANQYWLNLALQHLRAKHADRDGHNIQPDCLNVLRLYASGKATLSDFISQLNLIFPLGLTAKRNQQTAEQGIELLVRHTMRQNQFTVADLNIISGVAKYLLGTLSTDRQLREDFIQSVCGTLDLKDDEDNPIDKTSSHFREAVHNRLFWIGEFLIGVRNKLAPFVQQFKMRVRDDLVSLQKETPISFTLNEAADFNVLGDLCSYATGKTDFQNFARYVLVLNPDTYVGIITKMMGEVGSVSAGSQNTFSHADCFLVSHVIGRITEQLAILQKQRSLWQPPDKMCDNLQKFFSELEKQLQPFTNSFGNTLKAEFIAALSKDPLLSQAVIGAHQQQQAELEKQKRQRKVAAESSLSSHSANSEESSYAATTARVTGGMPSSTSPAPKTSPCPLVNWFFYRSKGPSTSTGASSVNTSTASGQSQREGSSHSGRASPTPVPPAQRVAAATGGEDHSSGKSSSLSFENNDPSGSHSAAHSSLSSDSGELPPQPQRTMTP